MLFRKRYPILYGAYCKNEDVLKRSSSGGVFFYLADEIIRQNGVVFGARFDRDWSVIHDYAESIDDIYQFMGSKYLMSNMVTAYEKVGDFLQKERLVLFTGTPCQCLAIKKKYGHPQNLYLVDFICHGVPTPNTWKAFLEKSNIKYPIESINFRAKEPDWEHYRLIITGAEKDLCENQSYLSDYILGNIRLLPACYRCTCKGWNRITDITMGDFWGAARSCPFVYNKMGTSAIMVHSPKGASIWKKISCQFRYARITKWQMVRRNRAIIDSVQRKSQVYVNFQ